MKRRKKGRGRKSGRSLDRIRNTMKGQWMMVSSLCQLSYELYSKLLKTKFIFQTPFHAVFFVASVVLFAVFPQKSLA